MKFNVLDKSLLGLGILSGIALAVPANPAPFTLDNQGDDLTLQRGGDEHYRFTRTSDGFLVVQGEDLAYYYANAQGEASKYKAKNEAARTAQEKAFLKKLNRQETFRAHREKHPDRFARPREHQAPKRASWVPTENASSSSESGDGVHPLLRLPSSAAHANGTNRFPVILVTTAGGREYLDSASFSPLLNKEGYSSGGYVGSVRDYFVDQSSGRFVPTFDVYKVSVDNALSSYTNSDYKLVVDAVKALQTYYPSFDASPYDSDNDGKVDAVGVFFSGNDDSGIGGYHYELRWNDVTNLNVGGKRFNSYFLLSQGTYPFASFIHEFSHSMGLADHYCVYSNECYNDFTNSQYQSPGAHAWDVMATGMYNNNGKTPPNYSAFERNFMGWLNYEDLDMDAQVSTVAPLHESNVAYKIPVSGKSDEWFIIENRQLDKWDSKLPNHGLLIWHIDFDQNAWDSDALNDLPDHQRIDVVEAGNVKVNDFYDGQSAAHLKDDPFPGSQNVTSYGPFVSWSGTNLNVSLYGIMEEDKDACFTTNKNVAVTTCKIPSSSSAVEVSSSSESASSSSGDVSSSSVEQELAVSSGSEGTVGICSRVVLENEATSRLVSVFDVQGRVLVSRLLMAADEDVDVRRLVGQGTFIMRIQYATGLYETRRFINR